MSDRSNRNASRANAAAAPIALVAAVWVLSDLGYYLVLPALGFRPDYNADGTAIAIYYLFWTGVAVIAFWPQYATWPRHARWGTFEHRLVSLAVWTLAFLGAVVFAAYTLPSLPPLEVRPGTSPPDLPRAGPWYFVPKSIDILFQQLLVAAIVLALAERGTRILHIAGMCAALFGAAHILLALGDVPWGYVVRFTVMATAFGAAFPWLLLRVPNGLAFSYALHWGFYAAMILVARTFGTGPG